VFASPRGRIAGYIENSLIAKTPACMAAANAKTIHDIVNALKP
jgi:hypothetical protein